MGHLLTQLLPTCATEFKSILLTVQFGADDTKLIGYGKRSCKSEVSSNISLPQETREISNQQHNLIPELIRKKRKKKAHKISRRKEILSIRAHINEKEIKVAKAKKSMTLTALSFRR